MTTTTTYRLDLPRYDLDWHIAKRARLNKRTGKPEWPKRRPVWDALRGNARNGHVFGPRAKATRTVISDVIDRARLIARIPEGPHEHIHVRLTWAPGRNTRADVDNLVGIYKACCDALARGRRDLPGLHLVPDDVPRWMSKHMPVIAEPPASGLWLTVEIAPKEAA